MYPLTLLKLLYYLIPTMSTWVTDGSKELSVKGNRIECNCKKSGEPYNALWKDDTDGGSKRYWKIRVETLSAPVFVGITDPSNLKESWGFNGLMYGRNLSDGGQLLLSNFGPEIKAGDSVGIFIDLSDENNLKVYFDVNGSSLGLAFEVPKDTLQNFYPAVNFSGKGAVTIERIKDLPSTTRAASQYEGMEGPWEYTSGSFEFKNTPVTMNIEKEDANSYQAIVHVINTCHIKIYRDNESSPWKGQRGMSTRMAGSSAGMSAEGEITRFMEGLTKITISGESLTILNEKSGKSTSWKRRVITKTPVTSVSF